MVGEEEKVDKKNKHNKIFKFLFYFKVGCLKAESPEVVFSKTQVKYDTRVKSQRCCCTHSSQTNQQHCDPPPDTHLSVMVLMVKA